jgi:hypothetical protein
MIKRTYTLEVIGQKIGFQEDDILRFVENSLISPYNFD